MEINKENIVGVIKRKRSINWDLLEKDLLRNCIKEFVAIIENKNTDTNTNKAKTSAWMKITQRFNEVNSRQRTMVEIKQQWRTTKLDAKKKMSHYQRERNATGGGEKPPSPDPVTNEILQMIPKEFEVDCNKFDSDGIILQEIKYDNINGAPTMHPVEVVEEIVYSPIHVENMQEITVTPSTSKPNKKKLLETVCHKSQKYKEPVKRKLPFEQYDFVKKRNKTLINTIETEHELKMKQAIEAHEWAKEEHELRLKEAKLRIKKLELENELLNIRLNKKDL